MTWFTADLHFDHAGILAFHRRAGTLDDMNERLVANWNAVVGVRDEVWVLGDFAWKASSAGTWFHALRGRKHLIVGNHDSNAVQRLPWTAVHQLREWRQKPHKAVLCHFPLLTWNRAHHGAWMLHGHSHGLLGYQDTTRMDVGVDTHPEFRPYHVDEVIDYMAQRTYAPVDGHHPL